MSKSTGAIAIVRRDVDSLIPYINNSRTHSPEQVAQIAASIKEFGWTNPILVDGQNGIIAGHGRLLAARKLGLTQVPVIELTGLSDTQKRAYIIADNKLAVNAGWDNDLLALELGELSELGYEMDLTGFAEEEIAAIELDSERQDNNPNIASGDNNAGKLSERFLVPPFTVLNAREGWWQDRKRGWLAMGIKSEKGRDIDPTSVPKDVPDYMAGRGNNEGGSIFDPVLCELLYRWFSPPDGVVLDCFAGGSVRGIVASKLGRQYIGHELRPEQVEANRQQGNDLCVGDNQPPVWIVGDSRNIDKTCKDVEADFVMSCPPYADLEVYSDNPQDLSTMNYDDFREVYSEIIRKTCARLKNNRFAAFVVGEVRDKKGNYYDFVGDTVQAFRDAGLHYYNEAILITAVGSLPIRAGKQFASGRKLGKTHQNILVFVKGDGKKAAQACGEVEISEDILKSVSEG